MVNKKFFLISLIILGPLALFGLCFFISHSGYSKVASTGIFSERQTDYIKCDTATTTDGYKNEYDEVKCALTEIHTGDTFLVNIGHGKQVIFTYTGTPYDPETSDSSEVDFYSEQDDAWQYQIMGSGAAPKKLTFRIADGYEDITGFSFRDMNYDGYLDLIDGTHQGAGANSWRFIFWFNPITETFESPDPEDVSSMDVIYSESDFNLKDRTMSLSGTSGPDGSYQYEYRFINGEWIQTHSMHSAPDETGQNCVNKEGNLIDGKMVEKKTLTPREADEHC